MRMCAVDPRDTLMHFLSHGAYFCVFRIVVVFVKNSLRCALVK